MKEKGIKGVIRVRRDAVGRGDVDEEEYKERNKIEGLFGEFEDEAIWICCSVQGRYGYGVGSCEVSFLQHVCRIFFPHFYIVLSRFISSFLSPFTGIFGTPPSILDEEKILC